MQFLWCPPLSTERVYLRKEVSQLCPQEQLPDPTRSLSLQHVYRSVEDSFIPVTERTDSFVKYLKERGTRVKRVDHDLAEDYLRDARAFAFPSLVGGQGALLFHEQLLVGGGQLTGG